MLELSSLAKLESLPPGLFQPLAAPGRDVYIKTLLVLFQLAQESHGLVSRERLAEEVFSVLSSEKVLAQTDGLFEEEPHMGVDESDSFEDRRRARGLALIRYLERSGWFRTEMQADQSAHIVLFDHSFRLLDCLHNFAVSESAPLQGIICSIHDLLHAASTGDNLEVRVTEAARQCESLLTALRELEHNIGVHMEHLLLEEDIPAVLKRLLHRYGEEIVDSGYHKLKTTDHVSRYRPALLQSLQVVEALSASESVHSKLHFLQDSFESLDEKIDRIDDRHKLFVDAAVRRVEKMLMGTSTVSGFASTVLSHALSELQGKEVVRPVDSAGEGQEAEKPLTDLFDFIRVGFVGSSSLFQPRRAAVPFLPTPGKTKRVSKRQISEARKETQRHLKRAMGKQRIADLATLLFEECCSEEATPKSIRVSDLDINTAEKLALVIYLRSYGDGSLGYVAKDVTPPFWVRKGEMGFYDFRIIQNELPEKLSKVEREARRNKRKREGQELEH